MLRRHFTWKRQSIHRHMLWYAQAAERLGFDSVSSRSRRFQHCSSTPTGPTRTRVRARAQTSVPVMLRVVDGPWPFPPNYQLAPQPLAALDLLEYPDPAAQRVGREVLRSLVDAKPAVLARRTARARVLASPRIGRLLEDAASARRKNRQGRGRSAGRHPGGRRAHAGRAVGQRQPRRHGQGAAGGDRADPRAAGSRLRVPAGVSAARAGRACATATSSSW